MYRVVLAYYWVIRKLFLRVLYFHINKERLGQDQELGAGRDLTGELIHITLKKYI